MQRPVPKQVMVLEEVVRIVEDVEDVLDVHGRGGERQVKFVELLEKEQLAWGVQEEVPQWWEYSQKPAKKHTESWG